MNEARRKISVFADLQNVSPKLVPAVLRCLTETWSPLVRVYGSVSKRRLRFFQGSGISIVEMASSKPGRNAVDIQITADAIEELYCGDSEAFAIVSADSDYTYVVRRIRERKPVFVFGPSKTPDDLKRACTEFYLLPRIEGSKEGSKDTRVYLDPPTITGIGNQLRKLVEEFISNTGRMTIEAFSEFVRQRQPNFSPSSFGARSISRLLRKLAVCELRPVRNAVGMTLSYELVLIGPDSAGGE